VSLPLAAAAYLLPLLVLVGIYWVIVRRIGVRFRPRKALLAPRSATGPLVGVWLALLAATWTLMDLAAQLETGPALTVTASVVVTAAGIAVIGLVIAQRITIFVLSLLGIAAQVAGIARGYGVAAAFLCLVVAAAVTWMFGLARGLLSREP
jgi:hypothetical protein